MKLVPLMVQGRKAAKDAILGEYISFGAQCEAYDKQEDKRRADALVAEQAQAAATQRNIHQE